MVCGNVLGKAKTTKVGMVWYEFNIVNESINESVTKVGIELLGQLKMYFDASCVSFNRYMLYILCALRSFRSIKSLHFTLHWLRTRGRINL